ncbi:g7965 [Coccomyxa viridis]|uniref:G7965 protein n=1 Tax=Coccomyxa viridis TaxID=1274662 RepID=A0ABP1FZA9_9CHLO
MSAFIQDPFRILQTSTYICDKRLRRLHHSRIGPLLTLMAQDTVAAQSDTKMWAMKTEGQRLFGRTRVSLRELMDGVALPETLRDRAFLSPQAHLTLSGAQRTGPSVTAAQLTSFVQKVQQDSLVSMQPEKPPSWSGVVRVGTVGLGSQGALSVLVLLDEQQQPWTFFIRAQQADDSTATTVKHVVCSLEDDLSGFTTLPQLSPAAWANWHRGADDVPTVSVQAIVAAAAEKSAKLPFDRVVESGAMMLSATQYMTSCRSDKTTGRVEVSRHQAVWRGHVPVQATDINSTPIGLL